MYIIKSKKILLKFVLLLSLISCTSHKLSSLQNKLLEEFKDARVIIKSCGLAKIA